jgi:hypothetical protein
MITQQSKALEHLPIAPDIYQWLLQFRYILDGSFYILLQETALLP